MFHSELPEGAQRKKANELMGPISDKWRTISNEECESYTEETVAALCDTRKMRELGSHNVPISSFHDVRVTLEKLEEEIILSSQMTCELTKYCVRFDVSILALVLKLPLWLYVPQKSTTTDPKLSQRANMYPTSSNWLSRRIYTISQCEWKLIFFLEFMVSIYNALSLSI